MSFFAFAADLVGKLVMSIGTRSLGEKVNDIKTQRRMGRLVDDAVDRIVEQTDEYLRTEKVSDERKQILISSLCSKLQPLADNPNQFFVGDLNGDIIFKQCHPNGSLPEEIREEHLEQLYAVLFPQIAHFLAGSRIALAEWQAEGFREEFKRLSQLAEEIRSMNAKVADLPSALIGAMANTAEHEAEVLLREFSQTLLNSLLLRLDLSPLRAERALHGSLGDHFVIPAVQEQNMLPNLLVAGKDLVEVFAAPGARRVVHGGAGVGKTTCSLWLQSRLLQADPIRLAVVLRLREISNIEERPLLDILRDSAGIHLRDSLSDRVLRGWHEAGRLVLILDGFDEVPENRRDLVEKWIQELALIAKRTSLIVTTRPLQSGHLEALGGSWQQWNLLPFDEPRIVEFIQRWHRYLPEAELSATERKVDAKTLARTFFSDPSLKPLSDTPLMLGTLLFVHHRDKKLPSGRVDLYERYIAAMLGLRDSGLGIEARATRLSDREKRKVLAHIALRFLIEGVNEASDETMRLLVTEALATFKFDEEADRLLPALCERTGLLQGPGAWSFMHKTIGEFLVAELICDGTTRMPDGRRLDRKQLWEHRHEDSWNAVLFFWAGKTSPRELEEFIQDLVEERNDAGPSLALALLTDQGDRLAHDSQRSLALRIIEGSWHETVGGGVAVCSSSPVPVSAFCQYSGVHYFLRGLTLSSNVDAMVQLLLRGSLIFKDLDSVHENHRQVFTVATIWCMGQKGSLVPLDVRHYLKHLRENDIALFCFSSFVGKKVTLDSGMLAEALSEWLEAFPFAESWVSLLLVGLIFDSHFEARAFSERRQRSIGPLLWHWREKPISPDWLRDSTEWKDWAATNISDLLFKLNQSLSTDDNEHWGVTPEQHADLLTWSNDLLEKRARLSDPDGQHLCQPGSH